MLSTIISEKDASSVTFEQTTTFGDEHDGAIVSTAHVKGGIVETSYFFGDLKPKNIIVISTQVGCPARCNFCEVGPDRFIRNLSPNEMLDQAILMLREARHHGIDIDAVPHKVTTANTGEPLLNSHLVEGLEMLAELHTSFKVSTVFPHGTIDRFRRLAGFAAHYDQPLQPQVSLISTSETYRQKAAGIRTASFKDIRAAADIWRDLHPHGRRINLSLILSEDVPCDADDVAETFPPALFRFRFRNYVPTANGTAHGLVPISQTRYKKITKQFKDKGYEVGTWATPTPTELRSGLAPNAVRRRYLQDQHE